ncbi:unnamed protein product [Orchesella dallaii]|uniref:Phospholipid scramblase n=1 Tax=Orchesella dallaii TaxID=48710 RepID=A0ABP1RGB9_9HEXA
MESKTSLPEDVHTAFEVMRSISSERIMGGRNSVNPEQSSSVVTENETEIEMESQLGSGFSGSAISLQEAYPYGDIFKRIREFDKLKDVNGFVTFLSAVQNETLHVYDVYELTKREKLYEGRKPNRRLPCTLCGCWNVHNFLSSRLYKEDVILLDNMQATSEEFSSEILRLRTVIRFMDGSTLRGTDVIGRYGTIGYIFPYKDYSHEIRDEVHNMVFRVERKVLAFKPAEYEVCKVSRIEVTYWVATLRSPKQGTVVAHMLSSGLPLSHKALIMAFSLYLVTFGS